MKELFPAYKDEPLYIQLYMYYRDLIINGQMKSGDKLPSIRKCSAEFSLSKMTVESAYMQLSAEGYVYAKNQSGYFVSAISDFPDFPKKSTGRERNSEKAEKKEKIIYDLSGSSVDVDFFDFRLWQKYIKNALRCEQRLLSYGDPQGEYDLRKALSDYASSERGVVCTPSQIVIGASVQNLLQLLCSISNERNSVLFSGEPFRQGAAVFEDYGFSIIKEKKDYNGKDKIDFIYASPSHYNNYNDVMSISERVDILNFAEKKGSIIIEDDYDSEFCYFSRPMSSLQGLDGGNRVVYIGSMSKLLLPSIRVSFMVLPEKLEDAYEKRGAVYNQTASKTEQIALARYITDGRLTARIRKSRKLYEEKTELMKNETEKLLKPLKISISDSGFIIRFDVVCEKSIDNIKKELSENGVKIKAIEQVEQKVVRAFVSSASTGKENIENSVKLLKKILY